MSNLTTLEEINQLLPDNNNGAITEANLRKCFEKTFTELGWRSNWEYAESNPIQSKCRRF